MNIALFVLSLTARPLNFISIGDWGELNTNQEKVSRAAFKYAKEHDSSFVLSLGDNFYESGVKSIYDTLWNYVYISNPLHTLPIPWVVSVGNHDYYGNVTAQIEYTHHNDRWYLPNNYYSIKYSKHIKFIIIDSQLLDPLCTDMNESITNNVIKREMYDWIELELGSDERIKIVVSHAPIYSMGSYHECIELQNNLFPILKKYGVKLFLHGHEHLFQHNQYQGIDLIGCGSFARLSTGGQYEVRKGMTKFYKFEYGFCAHTITDSWVRNMMVNQDSRILYDYTVFYYDRGLKPPPRPCGGDYNFPLIVIAMFSLFIVIYLIACAVNCKKDKKPEKDIESRLIGS